MNNRVWSIVCLLVASAAFPPPAAEPLTPPAGDTQVVTAKDTKVTFGFMTVAYFKKTREASMWIPPSGSTHHVDVRFSDAKTGKEAKDILAVTITVTGPKGIKESKITMDMRSMVGHFCQGFRLADKGNYRVTALFQGKRSGTATVIYRVE